MQRRPVRDKSVGLAFWAAFTPFGRELGTSCASVLCYFDFVELANVITSFLIYFVIICSVLFLQKESR
jgi:hypothetical protein